MQNRLAALMLALAITLVSFGSTAFVNTTDTIAQITEKVFGHADEMVILADEDHDYEYSN
jgi:hypothetical protein